jgi:alkylated DNA repair dioxygenase AlkB
MILDDINIYREFLSQEDSLELCDKLYTNIWWSNKLKNHKGEYIKINRMMAYVTHKFITYKYANLELESQLWNKDLIKIKEKLEEFIGQEYNSILLNLYEDGKDEIRWHSDKEPQLGEYPIIPCLNLGASRNFWFLNKQTGEKTPYKLNSGDLLIMGSFCQKKYLHAILKEKVNEPRISLTFRKVYDNINQPEKQTATKI